MDGRSSSILRRSISVPTQELNRFWIVLDKIFQTMFLWKEMWLIYLIAFASGRAGLEVGVYPFGISYFAVVHQFRPRPQAFGAAIAVTLGMATVAPIHRVLMALLVMGGAFSLGFWKDKLKGFFQNEWVLISLLPLNHLFLRVVVGRLFGFQWEHVIWLLIEAALMICALVIWRPLARVEPSLKMESKEEWLALALISVMLSLGLVNINIGPLQPAELWSRLITVLAALVGGATTAAAVGTSLGLIMGMSGTPILGGPMVYAVSGLLAGLFSTRGKIGAGLGFILGHLLTSLQIINSDQIVYSLMHSFISLAIIALIPNSWIKRVGRSIPGTDGREHLVKVRETQLKRAVSNRLIQVSQLFSEMGNAFAAVNEEDQPKQGEEITNLILEGVIKRHCQHCSGYRSCWEDNTHYTYGDVLAFLDKAKQRGGISVEQAPIGFKERCFQIRQFTNVLWEEVEQVQLQLGMEKRLYEQRLTIPKQLQGVSSLIEGLAQQVEVHTGRCDELQVIIAESLPDIKVPFDWVQVKPLGTAQRFEVTICKKPCGGKGQCASIVPVVSKVMENEYELWDNKCGGEDGSCILKYTQMPPYKLESITYNRAKKNNDVCGDALSMTNLADGRVAVILSDGMGSGERASIESKSAVRMLAKLLESGFDLTTAIKSVNSLLLLRTTEEFFATIDLALINLFTGEAEFVKVGAATSFIKRESEVEVIRSLSLPAGILHNLDFRVQHRQIAVGDMVIMMTDGVLDNVDKSTDREEWISRVFRREETDNPAELLNITLDRVRSVAGEELIDDISIVVLRLAYRERTGFQEIPEYVRTTLVS